MHLLWYGVVPALCSAAFFVGTMACRWLLKRLDIRMVLRKGAGLTVTGGASQLLLWLTHGSRCCWRRNASICQATAFISRVGKAAR